MTDLFDNQYFQVNKFFLCCIGQWPFHNGRRNRFIQFFIIITLSTFIIISGNGFLKVWGHSDKIMECLPPLFSVVGSLVYYLIYLYKEEKLIILFHEIKYNWELWSSGQEKLIIFRHARYAKIYTLFYAVCIWGTIFVFWLMSTAPQILDMILPLNESRSKRLPIQMDYFVNYSEEYFFWIMIHIALITILITSVFMGLEPLLAVFTEHACGLFKIIGFQLKNISEGSEKKKYQAVIFCVEQHNRAIEFVHLKFCNTIESLFCPCFFFMMLMNTIFISTALIEVVLNLHKPNTVIKFGAPAIFGICHLFLNSFPAQRLIDYSTALADNLYDEPWYQMPVRVKKLLLLIIMRRRIPCKLTAGKIIDISYRSAFSVLHASFSYFTLLSSVTS